MFLHYCFWWNTCKFVHKKDLRWCDFQGLVPIAFEIIFLCNHNLYRNQRSDPQYDNSNSSLTFVRPDGMGLFCSEYPSLPHSSQLIRGKWNSAVNSQYRNIFSWQVQQCSHSTSQNIRTYLVQQCTHSTSQNIPTYMVQQCSHSTSQQIPTYMVQQCLHSTSQNIPTDI